MKVHKDNIKFIEDISFQKGKLEEKKEELEWLEDFMRGFKVDKNGFTGGFNTRFTDERIKQLQKEIGEEKWK